MADSKKVAVAGGKDRFEELPDHVLELLLSFLDARNVVRTSVLAHRWRNLWKSVPVLRFRPSSKFGCAEAFNNFVNKVLECRDQTSPLRECHVHSYLDGDEDETHRDVESWVQYAVSCQVSVLQVLMWGDDQCNLQLSNNSVISRHLTDLTLYCVDFDESPLDLLSREALEVLDIDCCCVNLGDILPNSLRHLKIIHSTLLSMHTQRNRLSAPGLVTFELEHCEEWIPLLESLPSLATSSIIIGFECKDNCDKLKYLGDCGVESCEGCYVEDDCSVILEGLSGATNLKLISKYSMIFRKDLKWCPMFSKLKTVLLNEWCLTANFTGLLHFLQYSPILEKLTLQFSYHEKFDIKSSESYNSSEYFLVSKHLKIVEIHCCRKDNRIFQIARILGTHGVTPEQINIIPF